MAGQMQNANTDLFDAYFKRADLDGDGQISGAEAVAFFQGSGLPKQVLAQVWTHADTRKAGFLGRQEFYNALKLVTVAQRKRELTPDIVNAALNSPASAKIPAPQINLAATPSPRVATPGPQMTGLAAMTSQNFVVRPPQIPANQPYFPTQHRQFMRPPQPMPPRPASHPPQVIGSESMPRGGTVVPPRPPSSNISTDWLGAGMGSATSQIHARGVSPSATKNGFGLTAPGLTPSIQTRPQETNGHTQAIPSKQQNAVRASQHVSGKDSKSVVVSNGTSPDTIFGDVFSTTPAQTTQSSSSASSSTSSMPVSSLTVPSSVGSQASVKPSNLTHQQQIDSHSTGIPSQAITTHNVITSSGIPGVVGTAAPSQSQPPWPKMTQTGIQNYIKVFLQVDVDRDGKITGEQARNLFLSWRLPREILKQVWDLSDQDNDSMLSLREFCIALYLMERHREGRPLPATLPPSIMSDEILLSATNRPIASYGGGTLGPVSVSWQPQVMTGARPPPAPAARPPRPPPASHVDEKQPSQQKPKVPVLEKHVVDQLSQEEQVSLNSKFQEASQADKKVEELEKEISDSRQKMEFYRVKMQELILYKSRCDNRLNEVMERVSADKHEVEALAKKYETKYKEAGDVASRLTIEEATFRDIQESKMEVYRAIVKIEEGATGDGVLKERAEHIKSRMEELVKNLNDRCKQYGLRAKPTSLVELPFGWQPGIQEGAADWDEDWDKFEDEGFTFVKELTLDVQNVVAPPKPKSSAVQKETASAQDDLVASPKPKQVESLGKPEQVSSPGKHLSDKESAHELHENGLVRRPLDSPPARGATEVQSHEFQDSPIRASSSADNSPHAKEIQSDAGGAESVVGGEKNVDEPGWGTFDSHYDTDSLWGGESISGKDMDLGFGEFGLNPIRTGSSQIDNIFPGKSPSIFADSVPSTPAQGRSSYIFADSVPSSPAQERSSYLFADSVPSTPAYNQGKTSYAFADSIPSTPAYSQGKSPYAFADSVPSTPAYNFGNSPKRFSEGGDDHSFDSFSRFGSFSLHDGGLFQSPRHSLTRFDSIRSTSESDQNYGFPSRFDSFREAGDSDQSHGFSRFDSFKDSDTSHGFSKFDSFRDSDNSHGFSKFDSFRETDHHSQGFPPNFDSFGESRDSDHGLGFPPSFDSFDARDSGFLPSSSNSQAGFDSVRSPKDADNSHGFSSFDDADPFGSSGPFRTTTIERETPRSFDSWRAF